MGGNSIRFYERFPNEAVCYRYIADIKWASGFVCKKCGHVNYCAGKQIDPVYRAIVSAINGYASVPSKKDAYMELVTVLVAKYEALLMGRKSGKKDEQGPVGS